MYCKGKSIWNVCMVLPVVVVLLPMEGENAKADFVLGESVNLGPTVNSPATDWSPSLSSDGLQLYLESDRPGGFGREDLWVSTRATPEDDWGDPVNLGPTVNTAAGDWGPSISADGLELYFSSNRSGGSGGQDLWVSKRATRDGPWGTPVNLGSTVNSSSDEVYPGISSDGLELYFNCDRDWGLYVTRRASEGEPWGPPVKVPGYMIWPGISADGRILLFGAEQASGYGSNDVWMRTRATREDDWGPPVNLGPTVNRSSWDCEPTLSYDGSTLYFTSNRGGGVGEWDTWQVSISPVIDFNGDGKVDAKDMGLLADNWGKNNSLCDIGPFPWGDGVVDEKDLAILIESLVTPKPKASDVSCDVTVSWISPSFANTCDVYLGASQETVNTASRANPQGVLVSQGQTGTTYGPPEILELSQTYYWRVDFVVAGSAPTIIKGPVLQFTTAALTYPIKTVTATASSAQAGSGPENTVDGSGLDKTDGHSTEVKDMWWSQGVAPHWIRYEFDRVYTLHELWVWNMNQIIEPFIGFGAKTVKIEYSTDGTTWTPLANVPEFAKAPGKAGYTANTIVNFAGVPAKFVKLTIEKNWGVAPQTGLSEVRFFAIQTAAVSP